ncbi:MAG: hypothetical protein Q4A79_02610 [Candidatus Saccharibacteria bacterium]|nr:hypothetical protein [Candidatus Saccharibacteria bacterium]
MIILLGFIGGVLLSGVAVTGLTVVKRQLRREREVRDLIEAVLENNCEVMTDITKGWLVKAVLSFPCYHGDLPEEEINEFYSRLTAHVVCGLLTQLDDDIEDTPKW